MMVTVKWGIMGSNNFAHQFAESFQFESTELTAVSSRTLQKAYAFLKDHNIMKAYGSHEELAYDPEVDIVFIAVPKAIIKDTLLMALKANKHVVFIKSYDFAEDDMAKLVALAHKKSRLLLGVPALSLNSLDITKLHTLSHSILDEGSLRNFVDTNLD